MLLFCNWILVHSEMHSHKVLIKGKVSNLERKKCCNRMKAQFCYAEIDLGHYQILQIIHHPWSDILILI